MTGVESGESVAKRWAKMGFSFGVWEDPTGHSTEVSVHEVDQIVYVVSGRLRFELGDQTTQLAAGEETIIPAGTPHSVRNDGMSKARWYYGYKRKA